MAARRATLTIVTLAVFAALTASASGSRSIDTDYSSAALAGRLHFEVYLPAGYATSGLRYPVVYFLHGLPGSSTSYGSLHFVERALDLVGKPAILVLPQGAREGETDPEYVDRGAGDNWGTAITDELRRVVDERYRTIADRDGRALIGVSAGGYGAMHLALEHLDVFSVVESWSGYFHPTDPAGAKPLSLGSKTLDAKADVHEELAEARPLLTVLPTYIAFYVGRSDHRFSAENMRLDRELSQADIRHVFRIYPGGHQQELWTTQARAWLGLAVAHLAPAR